MLKKLTALSLSLLICLSLLPSQAGAMDAPEDEQPIQVEDVENLASSEDAGTGDSPDRVTIREDDGTPGGRNIGGPPAGTPRPYGPPTP